MPRMRHILARPHRLPFVSRRRGMPEPRIIFDFTTGRVYEENNDRSMVRDLMRSLRAVLRREPRVVLTAEGTPPVRTRLK
jgi:hypothetical protein